MGCGRTKVADSHISRSTLSKTIREVSVEYLGGAQIPVKLTSESFVSDNGTLYFDDVEYLKQTQAARLESLTVYFSDYINGIEVSYYIDTLLKTLTHATTSGKKARIDFFASEAIATIGCSYDDRGLRSIKITSTDGRKLEAVGKLGVGTQTKEIRMTPDKDIVGFLGAVNSHLVSLFVYLVRADTSAERSYLDPEID